jgi:proliferating cell nuclear antigen PCNA
MDPTHIVVVHAVLSADKFNSYYCQQPLKIGVDVVNLTKILKSIGNKDILTLIVENPKSVAGTSAHPDESDISIAFGLLIENPLKGEMTKIYIDTIDVDDHDFGVPKLNYPFFIQMPSSDMQSIITRMKSMGGEIIKVLFTKETLQFYSRGEIGVSETTRTRTTKDDSMRIQHNSDSGDESNIIEIYVVLEKLVEFTKCSCLSSIATIHLKNDCPLFLEYDVGKMGVVRLGVSPHEKPENF